MEGNGAVSPADVLLKAVRTGPVTVVTSGTSMVPNLLPDTTVTITHEKVRFGDLAAVVNDRDVVVVHRFVGSARQRLFLLGDANPRFDPPVARDRLIGKVIEADGRKPPTHRVQLMRRCLRLLPRELRHRERGVRD